MKSGLFTLALLSTVFISDSLFAQDILPNLGTLPVPVRVESAIKFPNLKSWHPPTLDVDKQMPLSKFHGIPFGNLGDRKNNYTVDIIVENLDLSPRYRYNMPIAVPDKTSKMLIAKLDENFPYKYKMPVILMK